MQWRVLFMASACCVAWLCRGRFGLSVFLFVVGASCWFSMRKTGHQLNAGVVWRILKRGICIFGLGLVYNWLPF